MIRRSLFLGCAGLGLAACASHTPPAPRIALDPPIQAHLIPNAPKPVEVVATPVPLPLPGQLKALDVARPEPHEAADPRERVTRANAAARVQPDRSGFVNAMQIWPFSAGALYQVYASPERVTDVALQPGEKLISISAGDTTRWVIGDTSSGTGTDVQVHVLVKPTRPDLKTNLLIYTDRRSYHLELTASQSAWLASVSWDYPQDRLLALRSHASEATQLQPVEAGVAVEQLRFRYKITGDNPSWRPQLAFDDGSKVYIQFPAGIAEGEMPPLFVISDKGQAQLVNYRFRSPYYVVDGLFGAAELRLGEKPQSVVRIARTDGQPER